MEADVTAVIVADVFEQGSSVPAALRRLGAQVGIEPLAAGDYRIRGGILIERKTVADLHGSLGRGRLWAQVGNIRDTAVTPFLLVEGDDLDAGPRHPNAIRGALLAIADLGVGILRSRDPADSALWIHRLALRQARKAQPRRRPEQPRPSPPPGLSVLALFPESPTRPLALSSTGSAASKACSMQAPNGGPKSPASAVSAPTHWPRRCFGSETGIWPRLRVCGRRERVALGGRR